jgi:uncharacterized protein involved in exopolysaccharide biosynthesis
LEQRWAELKAVDVFQGTRLLQRRWKILVAVTVAATLAAVIAAFIVPPIWESRANIQLGVVRGETLEDPRILARVLESDAVEPDARPNLSFLQPVRVQIVEATPGGAVAYLRILGRGRTPEEARQRVQRTVEFARNRHAELSERVVHHSQEYQLTLATTVKQLGESIAKFELIVRALKAEKGDGTIAAVLYQAQLEVQRSQYLQLAKELKDSQIQEALGTRQTRMIAPPSLPLDPIWPRPWVFVAVGGAVGFLLAALGVLMFARQEFSL